MRRFLLNQSRNDPSCDRPPTKPPLQSLARKAVDLSHPQIESRYLGKGFRSSDVEVGDQC